MNKLSDLQRRAIDFEEAAHEFAEEQRRKDEAAERAIEDAMDANPTRNPFKALWKVIKYLMA